MQKKFQKTKLVSLGVLFFLGALFFCASDVLAQEESSVGTAAEQNLPSGVDVVGEDNGWVPSPEEIEELNAYYEPYKDNPRKGVECFDYYEFQSAQVVLSSDKLVYGPGESVNMIGYVENQSDIPVTNGLVFMRLEKLREDQANGNDVLSEIVAIENISIPANTMKDISYSLALPDDIASGDYDIKLYFSVGAKFNLGGLPFTNEIIVGSVPFEVQSDIENMILFDRDATIVNDNPYNHIGSWPSFKKGESVKIVQPILNNTSESVDLDIEYELYFWDSLNKKDLIKESSDTINVPASGSSDLEYLIPSMDEAVYYLKISAFEEEELKAIVNIRLASDISRVRLNYPAINKFPIKRGEELTLFSCFHNTAAEMTNVDLRVGLYDKENNEVASINKKTLVSSAMDFQKSVVTAADDYEYLRMKAEIIGESGEMMDSYEVEYKCEDFDICKEEETLPADTSDNKSVVANQGPSTDTDKNQILIAVFVLAIIFVVIAIFLSRQRSGISIFVFFFLLLACMDSSQAASVQSSKHYDHTAVYWRGNDGAVIIRHYAYGNVNVTHYVNPNRGLSGMYKDDKVSFSYSAGNFTFNGTGGLFDTPYGRWVTNINHSSLSRESPRNATNWEYTDDAISDNISGQTWTGIYPSGTYMTSNNSSVIQCSGLTCTAVGPGSTQVVAHVPETQVRISSFAGGANNTIWYWDRDSLADNPGPVCNGIKNIWRHYATLRYPSQCDGTNYFGKTMSLPKKTITFSVSVANRRPTCYIDKPIYGTEYGLNDTITFDGHGTDPDGQSVNTFRWILRTTANNAAKDYSKDIVVNAKTFSRSNLPVDDYYAFLWCWDSSGMAADSWANARFDVVDAKPIATIIEPVAGQSFYQGEPIRLRGSASDPDGDSITGLRWGPSSGSNSYGVSYDMISGGPTVTVGPRTIYFAAESRGSVWSADDTVTVNILPRPEPSCSVSFAKPYLSVNEATTLDMLTTNDVNDEATCSCNWNGVNTSPTTMANNASINQSFTTTGTKECTCTVESSLGDKRTCYAKVEVLSPPSCSLSYSKSPITLGSDTEEYTLTTTGDADNKADCDCTGPDASVSPLSIDAGTRSHPAFPASNFSSAGTRSCTCTVENAAGATAECKADVEAISGDLSASIDSYGVLGTPDCYDGVSPVTLEVVASAAGTAFGSTEFSFWCPEDSAWQVYGPANTKTCTINSDGSKTVRVKARRDHVESAEVSSTINVPFCDSKPRAEFDITPNAAFDTTNFPDPTIANTHDGKLNTYFDFDASASYDPDGDTITVYEWSWGDATAPGGTVLYSGSGFSNISEKITNTGNNYMWLRVFANGEWSEPAVRSVNIPTPDFSIWPENDVVALDDNFELRWNPQNVTWCFASGNWGPGLLNNDKILNPQAPMVYQSQSITPSSAGTFSYTLDCGVVDDIYDLSSASVNIDVIDAWVNAPATVSRGVDFTVSWGSDGGVDSCYAGGHSSFTGPNSSVNGSQTMNIGSSGNYDFSIYCNKSGVNTMMRTVTVQVVDGPSVSIQADPEYIEAGDTSTINWSAGNVTSCTKSGGTGSWAGVEATNFSSQSFSSGAINSDTTFSISCTDGVNTINNSVEVKVMELDFTDDNNSTYPTVFYPDPLKLQWSGNNIDTCEADWDSSLGYADGGDTISGLAIDPNPYNFTLQCWHSPNSDQKISGTVSARVEACTTRCEDSSTPEYPVSCDGSDDGSTNACASCPTTSQCHTLDKMKQERVELDCYDNIVGTCPSSYNDSTCSCIDQVNWNEVSPN